MKLKRKILLACVVLLGVVVGCKIEEMVKPKKVVWGNENEPKVMIWQERSEGGSQFVCSWPTDCLDYQNEVFVQVDLGSPPNSPELCYASWRSGTIEANRLLAMVLYLNPGFLPIGTRVPVEETVHFDGCRSIPISLGKLDVKTHNIRAAIMVSRILYKQKLFEDQSLIIKSSCPIASACSNKKQPITESQWLFCQQVGITNQAIYKRCFNCIENNEVWTALGCIKTDPTNLIQTLIRIGLLVGGGLTLLIILAGAFLLTISQGDPKKTSEAKEMITSAIIGLIFIIFSVAILQFIGVQILQIPEFGEGHISQEPLEQFCHDGFCEE